MDDATLGTDRSDLRFGINVERPGGKPQYEVGVDRSTVHFPEFAKIAPGLRTIDGTAILSLTMRGPDDSLDTRAILESAAGNLTTNVRLNSTVPGWTGVGSADVTDFDVSQWLPTEGVSRITGRADFDLLLGLGRHFPRGAFEFAGPYTAYVGYEASNVSAKGKLTQDRAELDAVSATAYGSPLRARGWIAIAAPYEFHLQGELQDLDLRRLPASVPGPKVQTSLAFAYDTRGRFQEPYLDGEARFRPSTLLGAQIADGATGRLDTSKELLRYSGAGRIADLRLATVGEAFQVETLRDPAYHGTLSGDFDLSGEGSTFDDLDLRLAIRDATVAMFGGTMRRASFEGAVVRDSISGKFAADLDSVDPSIPTNDGRYEGAVSGRVALNLDLPSVLSTGLQPDTATIAGTLDLGNSRIGQVQLQTVAASGALSKGLIKLDRATLFGTGVELESSGTIPLSGGGAALKVKGRVEDLSTLSRWTPVPLSGSATVQGQVDGPLDQLAVRGSFTSNNLASSGVSVLTLAGDFSGTVPERDIGKATVTVKAAGTFLQSGGWSAPSISTGFTYAAEQLKGDIQASLADGRELKAAGAMQVHADHQEIHLTAARLQLADQAGRCPPG